MITKLLFTGFFLLTLGFSFGQDFVEIRLQGEANDISGLSYSVNATNGNIIEIPFYVKNTSPDAKYWLVTRSRVTPPPADWEDYFCWGTFCYTHKVENPWTMPESHVIPIESGDSAFLKIDIDPSDLASGSSQYRFYIGESIEFPEDSVDVFITTSSVSVKETNKVVNPVLSTYPNPADNFLTVSLQTAQTEGYLKMTDVLGKVVLEEKIIGTKKVDVEEFKNGVYVLSLNSNGVNTTKRVVVRH
ncbi:MAG: T9SS type A sorting domain-containing protein [Bacteroidota bacterium]